MADKPLISEETDLLEPTLLDELICHISSLASVYHKPPTAFVEGTVTVHVIIKNIRSNRNHKFCIHSIILVCYHICNTILMKAFIDDIIYIYVCLSVLIQVAALVSARVYQLAVTPRTRRPRLRPLLYQTR